MAAPTIYRSDDASAPVISGQASALRLALNAILVDGYGSQPAAGWTKSYEDAGNHLVAYQNAGLGSYLRVDDSPTRLAVTRGYRSMTGVSAGAEPFPSAATVDVYCRKSVTADSTARPWICLANERHFFLIIFGNKASLGSFDGGDSHLGFGELDSSLPGDRGTTFLLAGSDTSTTSATATTARQAFNFNNTSVAVAAPRVAIEASFAQTPQGVQFNATFANTPFVESVSGGTSLPAYPDPATAKLLISRKMVRAAHTSSGNVNRGYVPGMWMLCHPASGLTTFDTFSGSGSLAGRDFLIVKTGAGGVVFETTDGSW